MQRELFKKKRVAKKCPNCRAVLKEALYNWKEHLGIKKGSLVCSKCNYRNLGGIIR